MTKTISILLLFFSILNSNNILKTPNYLKNIKEEILKNNEFQPYCSSLLKSECFIHSNIAILGYSKKSLIAYIVDISLDTEDDGKEYHFIIQDLKTNIKIINIAYRYDSIDNKIILEKSKDLIKNRITLEKEYQTSQYIEDFFWKTRNNNILEYLNNYKIQLSSKNNINYDINFEKFKIKSSRVEYPNMFPEESFLQKLKIYKKITNTKSKQIYYKNFNNKYIYTSKLIGIIKHPYSKENIFLIALVKRGATGEPHLIKLDLFSEVKN